MILNSVEEKNFENIKLIKIYQSRSGKILNNIRANDIYKVRFEFNSPRGLKNIEVLIKDEDLKFLKDCLGKWFIGVKLEFVE